MKKSFANRLAAINWIADFAEHEGHFEVLREQLNYNFIYTNTYFLDLEKEEDPCEIVLLRKMR